MSDINHPEQQPELIEQAEDAKYTPASPVKRAMAWVGIVYMVILVALTTYMYFSGGVAMTGIAPLLAVPGLIGLGIVSLISHRTTGSPAKGTAWMLAVLCWLVAIWFLIPGIAGLMSNFA